MMVSKIDENAFGLFCINHTNGFYYNPLEDVDIEEKKSILFDIFNSSPVQGDLKVAGVEFDKAKGFFGGEISNKIYGYKCQKFTLNLRLEYMLNKKSNLKFDKSLEEYIEVYTHETIQEGTRTH